MLCICRYYFKRIMGVIKSLIKLTIGGGAIYYVVDSGLCKDQEKSIESYSNILNSVPLLKEYADKVPSLSTYKHGMIDYWNSGVKVTFSALASLPQYTKDGTKKGYDSLVESIKSQMEKK